MKTMSGMTLPEEVGQVVVRGAIGGVRWAGWPRVITHPGLPQIRTCGFPAYGSSSHTFAGLPLAIRWRCVDTRAKFDALGVFPPIGRAT